MEQMIFPKHESKKELFSSLTKDRKKTFSQFKGRRITFSGLGVATNITRFANGGTRISGEIPKPTAQDDTVRVKVVMSTSNWLNDQNVVLLPNAAKKTIDERSGAVKHIKDHDWSSLSDIGDVVSIYTQNIPLRELGVEADGEVEALIGLSDVRRYYDEKAFFSYWFNKEQQHSVGIELVDFAFAVNDDEFDVEFKNWQKYYPMVINKDYADETGYFLAVREFKLIEFSSVFGGSNPLTPAKREEKFTSIYDFLV